MLLYIRQYIRQPYDKNYLGTNKKICFFGEIQIKAEVAGFHLHYHYLLQSFFYYGKKYVRVCVWVPSVHACCVLISSQFNLPSLTY